MINKCHFGDCVETMKAFPEGIVQTCVTSPPYFGLRDYGHDGQIGLEPTPEQYISKLVSVFSEVKRILKDDGTIWLNIGDSYAGSGKGPAGNLGATNNEREIKESSGFVPLGCKPKDLIGIPWMLAFALRDDGWYLRQDIIWSKPNPMPESVIDRCTKSHEYIFLLSKSRQYFYDAGAIKEKSTTNDTNIRDRDSTQLNNTPGRSRMAGLKHNDYEMRNKRSVWSVPTSPYAGAHFAVFPPELIEPCILAGAPVGGVVLDPFFGSGTTGQVAQNLGRKFIGCELNTSYKKLQDERLRQPSFELY